MKYEFLLSLALGMGLWSISLTGGYARGKEKVWEPVPL